MTFQERDLMPPEYRDRQEAQLKKFLAWKEAEGGLELPVTLHTMLKPQQQKRVEWIVANATGKVLEVGCSWGMVLASINARRPGLHAGIDIAPWNVDLARLLCPSLGFRVADAKKLPYADRSFDTVVAAEILEHLLWPDEVFLALSEALRVARERVLITVPDGRQETGEANSLKHPYLMDQERLDALLRYVGGNSNCASAMTLGPFICITIVKTEGQEKR